MGKKYIIEFDDNVEYMGAHTPCHRCVELPWIVFDEQNLEKLTPYEEPKPQKKPFDFPERLNEALGRFWDGSTDGFAKACDIPELFIITYLSGDANPTPKHLAVMSKTLGVSADYLLGLEDNP